MTTCDLALATEIDDENPIVGDLRVVNGVVAMVRGADAVAQEIRVRLRWWKGEWFLDRRRGVPYLDGILRDGATPATVRAVILAELKNVPDLAPHPVVTVDIDARTRFCTVNIDGKVRGSSDTVSIENAPVGGA